MRVNHRTSTVQTKPWAVVEQGVRLGRGGWRAGPGADRRSTLGGPGRRWASFGRGGGGRSTGGGGGPAPCPERGSGPGWGRWRNASTTGPHGAPPRALRKKRESEEGQSSGGGGGGGRAAQKTWNDRIWARRKEEKDWSMLQEFGESLEERCSLCMKVVWSSQQLVLAAKQPQIRSSSESSQATFCDKKIIQKFSEAQNKHRGGKKHHVAPLQLLKFYFKKSDWHWNPIKRNQRRSKCYTRRLQEAVSGSQPPQRNTAESCSMWHSL